MSHLPPLKAAWCETCQTWKPTDHHHPSEAEWRERVEAAEARAEALLAVLEQMHEWDHHEECNYFAAEAMADCDCFRAVVAAALMEHLRFADDQIAAALTACDGAGVAGEVCPVCGYMCLPPVCTKCGRHFPAADDEARAT